MKKVLSIILALTFCLAAFSALTQSISAKSATISESEAKELIVKAYEFCQNVRADESYAREHSDEYRIEIKYGEENWDWDFYWLAKEENLPGGSYEKMCQYAETIYTEDIAARAYAYQFEGAVHSYEAMWEDLRPLFHRDENGVLYSASGEVMSYNSAYLYPNAESVELEMISGDAKTAKAIVSVYFHYIDHPRINDFDLVECRFENTADGWRIADSEYSLVLATEHAFLEEYRANDPDAPNPSKGKMLIPDAKEAIDAVIGGLNYDSKSYYLDYCTEQATEKIMQVNRENDLSFVYDPETAVIEIIDSTDKEATVRVYCGLKDGDKVIPISVECKFVKGYRNWHINDSDFVDMLTSADGFEYTVGEAPATGDNAFDTIAVCLGGMAIVMSVLCIVRRKREF